eukprot:UN00171
MNFDFSAVKDSVEKRIETLDNTDANNAVGKGEKFQFGADTTFNFQNASGFEFETSSSKGNNEKPFNFQNAADIKFESKSPNESKSSEQQENKESDVNINTNSTFQFGNSTTTPFQFENSAPSTPAANRVNIQTTNNSPDLLNNNNQVLSNMNTNTGLSSAFPHVHNQPGAPITFNPQATANPLPADPLTWSVQQDFMETSNDLLHGNYSKSDMTPGEYNR